MEKNKIIIGFVLLLFSFNTFSQNPESNQSKYWFYRFRLTNEFLKKCEAICGAPTGSGCSIPASGAYQGHNDLHFGDGTSFLGYYIGVLSMELRLLTCNGAKPEQIQRTKYELYMAMKAYERLDKNAEKLKTDLTGSNCEENMNGFFIRDDVPANKDSLLGKYFEDGNFKTPLRPGSSNYKTMKTDLTDTPNNPCQNTGDDGARYPSQDQVSDLFMGFSLAQQCLRRQGGDCMEVNGFSSTYYTEANGNKYYFADQAKFYSSLIMDYLTVNNYKIKVPNLANSNSKTCYAKYGGTEAQLNAYGIAKAGANVSLTGAFGDKKAFYIGLPKDDGLYQSTVTFLTRNYWQNFLGYPNKVIWKYNYTNSKYPISTGLGDIHIPTFQLPTGITLTSGYKFKWTTADAYEPFTIPGTFQTVTESDYNNGLMAQFGAIGNSWKVGLEPYVALDKSITFPWVCSSAWMSCHDECICCRSWCDVKMEVCYPEFAFWECSETVQFRIWCYGNPTRILQTYFANMMVESQKELNLPLGQIAAEVIRLLKAIVPDITFCAPIKLPEISYNTTALTLSEYGNEFKFQPFALLHKYLHNNGIYNYSKDQMKYYMNTAPPTGPRRYPIRDRHNPPSARTTNGEIDWSKASTDYGVYGWRADNRWQKTNADYYDAVDSGSDAWPGLDYMFLHNLYYMVHGGNDGYPTFKDKLDVRIEGQTLSNTKTYLGFESLVSGNTTVASSANITYRSGNCIKLTNGFSAKQGSSFHAIANPVYTVNEITDASTNARIEADPNEPKADTLTKQSIEALIKAEVEKVVPAFKDTVRKVVQAYKKYEPRADYIARKAAVVSARTAGLEVNLSPNPASNNVVLYVSGNLDERYTWSISNAMGITSLKGETCCYSFSQNAETIDISHLQPGAYNLKVSSGGNTQSTHFIKQ